MYFSLADTLLIAMAMSLKPHIPFQQFKPAESLFTQIASLCASAHANNPREVYFQVNYLRLNSLRHMSAHAGTWEQTCCS